MASRSPLTLIRLLNSALAALRRLLPDIVAKSESAPPLAEPAAVMCDLTESRSTLALELPRVRPVLQDEDTILQPRRPHGQPTGRRHLIEIRGFVARGGMGCVYYALRHQEGAPTESVALKRLVMSQTDSEQLQRRLMHEGEVGLWLEHPNIVKTLDVLSFLHRGQHEYALLLEWIHGPTLGQLLKHCRAQHKTLTPAMATEIVRQVAEGLAYCQNAPGPTGAPLRLVHRDLKPANLMLTQLGIVKIMDFGIARYDERTQLTIGGVFKGTLAFTSPEALHMHISEPSAASDIFSLGLVFYRLLMDRLLVQPRTLLDALRQMEQISANLQHLPEQLAPLRPLLQSMLELVPEKRCADHTKIAKTLAQILPLLPGGTTYEQDLRDLIQAVPLVPPHQQHEELDKVTSWPPRVVYSRTGGTKEENTLGLMLESTVSAIPTTKSATRLQRRIQTQLFVLLALMAMNILLLLLLVLMAGQ